MSLEEAARLKAMIAGRPPAATIEARRAGFEAMAAGMRGGGPPPGEAVTLGGVPGRAFAPTDGPAPGALLYLHGGAFVLGSSSSYAELCQRLADASGRRVVCPDYRLAPEHVFPAALEDAAAAWAALAGQGEPVALGGDSCGANLALSLAQRLIRDADHAPDALYLVSPYLDLTHSGDSVRERADRDVFVRPETMPGTAATYLGDAEPTDPAASPLFGEGAGLPRTLIQLGSEEVLYDDAARLASRLEAAGVPVALEEWEGMIHAFTFFGPALEEARDATARAGAFLRGE